MLFLHLIASALAFLTPSIIALPAHSSSLSIRAASEQWSIATMELHMMTQHSGIPGGAWSPRSQYPSTIDFELHVPGQIAHCHTEFANGTLPDPAKMSACLTEGDAIRFTMDDYKGLGERRRELSFVLRIWRIHNQPTEHWVFACAVAITANEPTQPTSYLTCLLGPPFDGLRCKLNGVMSNRKDLVIEASEPVSNSTDLTRVLVAS